MRKQFIFRYGNGKWKDVNILEYIRDSMDIEKVDLTKDRRQIEFDHARKNIIESLKTISAQSELLFKTMPEDKNTIDFIDSVRNMTEKIAQRYANVSRQIKDKNPELEPEFIKIMNQTLQDFCGTGLQLRRKLQLRKNLISRD